MLEDPTRWLHVGQSNMLKIRGWPNDTKHHSTCLIKLMRRIGLWVRISPSVHHVVTSTDVCNMAESKEKFKRCLSVLLVLDELEETEDRASKRAKTRERIRRRQESGYFTNIVRELADEDTPRIYRVPLRSKPIYSFSLVFQVVVGTKNIP